MFFKEENLSPLKESGGKKAHQTITGGKYTAKTKGELLTEKLAQTAYEGRIHSIFPQEINVEVEGFLCTIGKPIMGNGPYTVLLPAISEDLSTWKCAEGDTVQLTEDCISFGEFQINLTSANVWLPEWQTMPQGKPMLDLLPQFKALVLREGNLRGLGYFLLKDEEGYEQEEDEFIEYTQQVLIEQAEPLLKDIFLSLPLEGERFWCAVKELIGLGPGATPAGDDFVLGLLSAFRYMEFGKIFELPEIDLLKFAEEVRRNTNLVSGEGIILAIQGKPFELVRDVLENLFGGKRIHCVLSTLRLIERGSTSGTDILTGIIMAVEILSGVYASAAK